MEIHSTSALEQLLVRFWSESLGKNVPDAATDFFAAGGRAHEARKLLSLVKGAFHVTPRVDTLRDAPTVKAFAEALKHQVDHPGRLERVAERLLNDTQHAADRARQREGSRAQW
jgi:hypothetical protein